MAAMSVVQRNAFLQAPRIATLVTVRLDGTPAAVAVWYEWDGARARLFTDRSSAKVAQIRVDPRVTLFVAEPTGKPEAWVSIEGRAAALESGGMPLAERLAPRYYPAEQARRALEGWAAQAQKWAVIEITPARIRSLAPG